MSQFYVVLDSYCPNTAVTNRIMGMLKRFSERGVDANVVFFRNDSNNDKAPELPHIKYTYLGDRLKIRNDRIQLFLAMFVYSRLFIAGIKPGDVVYVYGCDFLIPKLVDKKCLRVFHERTESPDVVKNRFVDLNKYLKSCAELTGMFVISNQLKEYFIKKGVDPDKIDIINMTVDTERFEGLEKEETERYIAYCGKATNNKDGVDELIKAFAITSRTHPDVKLYIIGTPPDATDESGNLVLTEKLGVKDRVKFTGIVSSSEMPQILKNAEVLALDRPHNRQAQYGFPTKLGEYLLTGNVVVITRVGDIPLFLENGVSALLAEPNNPKDFSDKLSWALDNPEQANVIGLNGRSVALKSFNSKKEFDKIITKIIENK